jgi:hypothetical protein
MLSWHEIKLLTGLKIPKLYPHSWASDILLNEVCSERERSLFIIGMYSLWMQRNNRRHGENQLPVRHAVQWVVDLAHDRLGNHLQRDGSSAMPTGPFTWGQIREQRGLCYGPLQAHLSQEEHAGTPMDLMP